MSGISRRNFMKCAGAAALAVASSGVLAGCSKDDLEKVVTKDVKILFMCNGAVVPGDQQTIKVAKDAETVALSEIPASYYPFGYKVTSTGDLKIQNFQGTDAVLVMVEELEVEVTVHFYDKDTKEDVKIASFWCGASTKSISKAKADELAGDWCTIDADEKAPFPINWQDCTIRIAAKKN